MFDIQRICWEIVLLHCQLQCIWIIDVMKFSSGNRSTFFHLLNDSYTGRQLQSLLFSVLGSFEFLYFSSSFPFEIHWKRQLKLNFEQINFYDSHYSFTHKKKERVCLCLLRWQTKFHASSSSWLRVSQIPLEADALLSVSWFIKFPSCHESTSFFSFEDVRYQILLLLRSLLLLLFFVREKNWQFQTFRFVLTSSWEEEGVKRERDFEGFLYKKIKSVEIWPHLSWLMCSFHCFSSSLFWTKHVLFTFTDTHRGRTFISRDILPPDFVPRIKPQS